jgi:hypothetical protein
VCNATDTVVNTGAAITTDATNKSDGGKIVSWSGQNTDSHAAITEMGNERNDSSGLSNSLINYQGMLTDQTGAPSAAGEYMMQFRLWNSPTSSNARDLIWREKQCVTVLSNGMFNVILGSNGGSPIPGTAPDVKNIASAFVGGNFFLGVTVVSSNSSGIASPTEILPHQQLLSVPYALEADNCAANSSMAIGAIHQDMEDWEAAAAAYKSILPWAIQSSNALPKIVEDLEIACAHSSAITIASNAVMNITGSNAKSLFGVHPRSSCLE